MLFPETCINIPLVSSKFSCNSFYYEFTLFTAKTPVGDNEIFSTVALSSSTLADMGACPLLSGFIFTWMRRLSLSESESESV